MHAAESVCVVSHRRSGTHLTIDNVLANFACFSAYETIDRLRSDHHAPAPIDSMVAATSLRSHVLKSHLLPRLDPYALGEAERGLIQGVFEKSQIVYVVRHGMDVMVSLFEYMKSFDEYVRTQSFSEFLRSKNTFDGELHMNRPQFWAHHVQSWTNRTAATDRILIVSFEDWTFDFDSTINRLARHLGERPQWLRRNVHVKARPTTFRDRLRSVFFPASATPRTSVQLRSGATGSHAEVFSEDDLDFFWRHAGDCMEQLGYARPDLG
jgi:hypothetical protein